MQQSASITAQVNYIDIDAGGVVHHANYLRWFEQARGQWLRDRGFAIADCAKLQIIFVVASIKIDYLKPVKLDTQILATAELSKALRSSAIFSQQLICNDTLACEAQVTVVCLSTNSGKPTRFPAQLV